MPKRNAAILYPIREGGRLGFMDVRGRVVIPARFENDRLAPVHHEGAVDFSDWVPVKTRQGWGYLDASGDFAIPPSFATARPFSEDLAAVSLKVVERSYGVAQGRWGYIDRKGKVVIPPRYGCAEEFQRGLGIVAPPDADGRVSEYATQFGLIDRAGGEVVPADFERIYPWQEGLALTWKSWNKIGYLDEKGAAAIPFEFTAGDHFNEGCARIERGKRRGLIDRKGDIVFWSESAVEAQTLYGSYPSLVCTVSEGLVLDVKGGKCGFRNTDGSVAVDYAYDDAMAFSEGQAGVKLGKKWGFVDRAGRRVVEPQYEEVGSFHEGRAQVKVRLRESGKTKTRCGFIDGQGRMVIEPRFTKEDERELAFRHGLAAVVLEKRRAYVDRAGALVWRE
jgi:hypothetical protein